MLLFLMKKIHFFWQTFGYLVASEKRIPSTKLLQRISLSILRLPASPLLYREYRWRPRSRPTCGFGEPVHCFAAIRPVSKVTEHCQTASRKSDRTLHRPSAAPLQLGGGTSRPPQGLLATPKGASLCPTDLGLKGAGRLEYPQGPDGPRRRDFGWWIRQQHAPMFVFRTSTRWYMGTRMPKKSQCKGIVFLSVQSFVPLFSLFPDLSPRSTLFLGPLPVLFYLSLSP
ncbi:hypothetical protein PAPYR_12131 [Paratrimastix pyriformis]|uniref:Uncharacterized protein n=1 Tax=Paratrimastix pyriformis TaxID=342808 RepID=A0ABQ8U2E7_9EUKA|nr:hypothetical protein PAPYR_12131 [Paratrimastix pyriformis]